MFLPFVVLALLSSAIVRSISEQSFFRFLGMIWLLIISAFVLYQIGGLHASPRIKQVVLGGYLARIIFAWVQTYAKPLLPGFIADSDEIVFLRIGLEYFNGDFSSYSTNLPILIQHMFRMFGVDEFVIRAVFIYFWFLGILLLEKVAGELKGRTCQILVAFYTFLPWSLLISTSIFREPIKQYFLMLSVYFLWKWMGEGRFRSIALSILVLIPALWLHNGEVAMAGVIALTYLMWDYRHQRWRKVGLNAQTVMILIGILMIPVFYNVFVKVFPGKFAGTFAFWDLLNEIVYTESRTAYVKATVVGNLAEFAYWTAYRMFYFWASPTPRFWSSPADMFAFAIDTIPWLIFLGFMARSLKRKRFDPRAKVAVLIWGFFTFIYGWGTQNAGTAMRHRDHLLGLLVMTALMRRGNCTASGGRSKEICHTEN